MTLDYRGEQFDPDLGLYYLRARYYNPLSGRFMSRDPNDPQPLDASGAPTDPRMLHKYLYADGDPVNMADPRGRAALYEYPTILVQSVENVVGMGMYDWAFDAAMCYLNEKITEAVGIKYPEALCEAGTLGAL